MECIRLSSAAAFLALAFVSPAAAWQGGCNRDAMTDKQVCQVTDQQMNVAVFFSGAGVVTSVCALRHDFPGVPAMIRVDGGAAIEAGPPLPCTTSPKVVKPLLSGRVIKTRHMAFPSQMFVDKSTGIAGLRDAIRAAVRSP